MNNATVALQYLHAGLSLLPVATDGSKAPAIAWKPYQAQQPTPDEVQSWCSRGLGIGIIGGAISGHLEILDFDAPELFAPWCDMVEELAPGLVQRLPLVKTPSHGRHLYYRCGTIAGNAKLAESMTPEGMRGDTLIETRGEGGYVLSPLCPPACHTLHKPYQLIDGDLADIPTITPEERTLLLQAARSFNEYIEPERTVMHTATATANNGDRPGDAYNARATWDDILAPHGWTRSRQRGEVTLWKRPGKDSRGWSATTGYGRDLLYVFSTNAVPFEDQHSYSKFAAYAWLEHRGDYAAAAKALAARGYRSELVQGEIRHGGIRTIPAGEVPRLRTIAAGEVPSWRR